MKNPPKYMRDALLILRTRLNHADRNNMASDEIKAHLRAIDGWLSTWVLPAVDCIDAERTPGNAWMFDSVANSALEIRVRGSAK
jgi:hypothetical protein